MFGWFSSKKNNDNVLVEENIDNETPIEEQEEENNPNIIPSPIAPHKALTEDMFQKIFIADDDPNKDKEVFPIVKILRRLNEDYSDKGLNDAKKLKDRNFLNGKIQEIKADIILLFEEAEVVYSDMMSKVEYHIEYMKDMGMFDTVRKMETDKAKITKHMSMLAQKKQDFLEGVLFDRIKTSYECGYMRGIVELSQEDVTNIMSNYE